MVEKSQHPNSKLNLNPEMIRDCRRRSKNIALDTQAFIDLHTTTSTERAICRLLQIDGITESEVPLPNVIVDQIQSGHGLESGVARYIGNAMLHTSLEPQEIAESIADSEMNIMKLKMFPDNEIFKVLNPIVNDSIALIKKNRHIRKSMFDLYGDKQGPLLYLIVATGNIYEDVLQAKAAARQGADVIAVIRSTGQSLLDYVPYGPTTEGYGGTYATQENFKIMRSALDEVSQEHRRYIRLCNYCSGLCMPEIAVMGAFERLDFMLNDALYGILFRDINMQRTIIDQHFSRLINSFAGVVINTGEDNYLTTADAYSAAHTVLASQFLNEQFALLANLPEEQIGLGHAFEMNPDITNGFLLELAQAQMAREIFPREPLKYMPPTKYITGNIFKAHVQDALFNIVTILTNQRIHLLGMLTEGIHTPFMADRALSIENALYVFNNMQSISDEIYFKPGGIIQTRANQVLDQAHELLIRIEALGLFSTIEQGIFANIKRSRLGGKGLEGVIKKAPNYYNPFISKMEEYFKNATNK